MFQLQPYDPSIVNIGGTKSGLGRTLSYLLHLQLQSLVRTKQLADTGKTLLLYFSLFYTQVLKIAIFQKKKTLSQSEL